ncbi:hypothetical protein KVV02_002181 [Mortierella alpina]|uniref:RlpA-like protein double-psi beta-barrel domain-containing protein n=1 Tax=Mortierella alpina TaxID=64518 RepID=A0A9P8CZ51_MORAP|nr:hypothetical protein KVV02_002181 [Mortierella alpina]
MAPIPRIAAKPLSIITGALFSAFSSPSSSPPTNGGNATAWGTEYNGSASLLNFTLLHTPSTATPTSSSSSWSSTPTSTSSSGSTSTVSPTASSLVYFNTKTNTFTGCNKQPFAPTDNVVLMNALQFGDISSTNSTCGEWIQVQNRENTMQSTYAQIVGVCEDCEYGSIDLSIGALSELAPDMLFEEMVFDDASLTTVADLIDPSAPLPIDSTPVSPKNLLSITWSLSDAPAPVPSSGNVGGKPKATPSSTSPSSTTTTTTSSTPAPTAAPGPPSTQFSGRATWYSDTTGQCEHSYSQSDLIVAVNEDQMGKNKNLCGKKLLVTKKGTDIQVVVTVVDMCPKQYCNFGDLDLSQGAFKKFADLGVGVLKLDWSFM